MEEVTVVIPAYNAAHSIERAVKSLLAQTLPVKIVVVNDGSTDATAEVAEALGAYVITQNNAGAYMARVVGANAAKTPYVGFMDADDYAHPDMYEKLLAFSKRYALDIAQCDYTGKSVGIVDQKIEELFLSPKEIADGIIPSRFIRGEDAVHVWDKLYRAEMVRGFEPSRIMMFDDLAINAQAFVRAKRIGYLHKVLYDYDVNEGSSVRNFRLRNIEDLKEAIRFRRKYYTQYGVSVDGIEHARWICLNVKNMYRVASSAPVKDGVPKMKKIRALLDLPEVVEAFQQLGKGWSRDVMRNRISVNVIGLLKRCYKLIRP